MASVRAGGGNALTALKNQLTRLRGAVKAFGSGGLGAIQNQLTRLSGLFGKLGPICSLAGNGFFKLASSLGGMLRGGIMAVIPAVWSFTTALLANPITWVIAGIAALGVAIYALVKNWDRIKAWLAGFWDAIKAKWSAVTAWFSGLWGRLGANWRSGAQSILKFLGPLGFIASAIWKNWDALKTRTAQLISALKNSFGQAFSWLTGLGSSLRAAGGNLMESLFSGITAKASLVINKIQDIAAKIRSYWPFSPARQGPLRDIHRMKLIETIAESLRPSPLMKAVDRMARAAMPPLFATPAYAAAMGAMTGFVSLVAVKPAPQWRPTAPVSPAAPREAPSQPITIHYEPKITITAAPGETSGQFVKALKTHEYELFRIIEEMQRRAKRREY
jgi:phage-related protein